MRGVGVSAAETGRLTSRLRDRAWNAAHYLLDHGPVLEEATPLG